MLPAECQSCQDAEVFSQLKTPDTFRSLSFNTHNHLRHTEGVVDNRLGTVGPADSHQDLEVLDPGYNHSDIGQVRHRQAAPDMGLIADKSFGWGTRILGIRHTPVDTEVVGIHREVLQHTDWELNRNQDSCLAHQWFQVGMHHFHSHIWGCAAAQLRNRIAVVLSSDKHFAGYHRGLPLSRDREPGFRTILTRKFCHGRQIGLHESEYHDPCHLPCGYVQP